MDNEDSNYLFQSAVDIATYKYQLSPSVSNIFCAGGHYIPKPLGKTP